MSTNSKNDDLNLKQKIAGKCFRNFQIAPLTHFKIGGPIDYFAKPKCLEDLKVILAEVKKCGVNYKVLGNMSNVLISEAGYRGMVIYMKNLDNIEVLDEEHIKASAGANLSALIKTALNNKLSGAEFYVGIPGTVGGAIVTNAGTLGFETSEIVEYVEVLTADGKAETIKVEDMEYSFRKSTFKINPCLVGCSATFRLRRSQKYIIREKMREFSLRKRFMQPIDLPSAGCIYIRKTKNDYVNDLLTGSGLAGFRYGGAKISERYPNYIVNENQASFSDVMCLMETIESRIERDYGIKLEKEITIIP